MQQVYTRTEIEEIVRSKFADGSAEVTDTLVGETMALIDHWIERGDRAAVYENVDLSHPDLGHKLIVSWGSEAAQLVVPEGECPPDRLPDIGGNINWRYYLQGVYRGEDTS